MLPARAAILAAGLCLSGCGSDPGTAPSGFSRADLPDLFAPPTPDEIRLVLEEWSARDLSPAGVRTEAADTLTVAGDSAEVRILSHLVDGERRYDSEGVVSPWDGEVEDALAFLRVAGGLPHVAGEGAAAIGFSAGATTALLAAAREPAIAGVVDFFAPVDFYGPFVKDLFIRILDGDPPDLAKIPYLETQIVDPLRRGELSLAGMRLELLRRSPVYFADRLPPVLAHHGLEDAIVPDGETRRLAEAVGAAGGRIEAHYYAGSGHSPLG